MRTIHWIPMQLVVIGAALVGGIGELVALQAWRLRDRLAGRGGRGS